MLWPLRRCVVHSGRSLIESLEMRRLLSVALSSAASATDLSATPAADATSTTAVLTGMNIYAETNQRFVAVLGKIGTLPPQPSTYRLRGQINWGDGSPNTFAVFVPQPGGTIDVLGAHTYASAGTDNITVTVLAVPPPWSTAPVLLVGSFKSTATVFTDPGGVTQEEPVGIHFTQTVGFFRTTVSSLNLSAIIDWGDGQQSPGKILALPTAGPMAGGSFAVVGDHTYSAVASYLVHTTIYQSDPTASAPPTTVVAKIASVFDVLPISPTATTWLGGDANDDGQVNVGDLADMAGNFGTDSGATWEMGDFDGNGTVNVADLADLAANFGSVASFDPSTMTASATSTTTTVTPSTAPSMAATPAASPSLAVPGADWTSKFDGLFSAASIRYTADA